MVYGKQVEDTCFYGKSLDNIYLVKYNMTKDRDKIYPEEEHHGTGIRAVITW